jgi:uncharacterized protein (DUF927 family)
MVAYAGELATANGITGWKNGDAQSASIICFNDWIKYRGGTSNQEVNDIITQVKLFIEKYNDSRFRNLSSDTVRVINEMAGYKEEIEGGYQYLVMPNVFRDEICKCKGERFRNNRNLLYKNGLLKSVDSEVRKIDGASIRCYTILPKVLE